jgi:hypothetical protein
MKKIFLVLIALGIIGASVGYYMYNKPIKDYTDSKAELSITASELFLQYSSNEQKADSLYREKVIAVSGNVSEISKNQKQETVIYLGTDDPMFGIQFTMLASDSNNYKSLRTGEVVSLKGLCTGFTNDVVITNATVHKQ